MLPCFLCLLQTACTVFLPESPRWLVSIGDVQRATSILQAAATTNGRSLPPGRFVLCLCSSVRPCAHCLCSACGRGQPCPIMSVPYYEAETGRMMPRMSAIEAAVCA